VSTVRRPSRVLLLVLPAVVAAAAVVLATLLFGERTGLVVARGARYAAIGGATGLLGVLLAVWSPLRTGGALPAAADDAFVGAAGRALRALAVLGMVASASALGLQAAQGSPGGPSLDALGEVLATRAGGWYGVGLVAFVALAALAVRAVHERAGLRGRAFAAAAGLVAVLVLAPVLGGHAVASDPAWALVPIGVLHVAAMGAWVGGLVALVVVLPRASAALPDDAARTRLLAGVTLRFSPVAIVSVAVLTVAGTALALLHLTTLYDLTDTAYGRAILVKVVLLLAVISVAVLQREFLVPRLQRLVDGSGTDAEPAPEATPGHVRLAMRSELALLLAVLVTTGALAGTTPPKSLSDGPVTAAVQAGAQRAALVVDPARRGPNGMRLTVRGRDGRPAAGVRLVRARAVPPGRSGGSDVPVDVAFVARGAGRWAAAGVPLGTAGGWTVEIVLRPPGDAETTARLAVRVR
jgi:copper transport protein